MGWRQEQQRLIFNGKCHEICVTIGRGGVSNHFNALHILGTFYTFSCYKKAFIHPQSSMECCWKTPRLLIRIISERKLKQTINQGDFLHGAFSQTISKRTDPPRRTFRERKDALLSSFMITHEPSKKDHGVFNWIHMLKLVMLRKANVILGTHSTDDRICDLILPWDLELSSILNL